ncbi:MAG TPA: hypothetical protein ENJ82_07190 [Bacteroidetes bacterium]|nr:hypothetical protein [Bacteroidota bacterium]
MRLSPFILFFGILTLLLYSLSWLSKFMHWPLANELRYLALLPFVIGLVLIVIDKVKHNDKNDES